MWTNNATADPSSSSIPRICTCTKRRVPGLTACMPWHNPLTFLRNASSALQEEMLQTGLHLSGNAFPVRLYSLMGGGNKSTDAEVTLQMARNVNGAFAQAFPHFTLLKWTYESCLRSPKPCFASGCSHSCLLRLNFATSEWPFGHICSSIVSNKRCSENQVIESVPQPAQSNASVSLSFLSGINTNVRSSHSE